MKSYWLIILIGFLLIPGCNKQQPAAMAQPRKFQVKFVRIFNDGTHFDLTLDGQFEEKKVKATLQGEINGEAVNSSFTLDDKKSDRWQKVAAKTAFLAPQSMQNSPEVGGIMEVFLYDADGAEASGEPNNPGEWRNMVIESITIAQKSK